MGSEMCIRDSWNWPSTTNIRTATIRTHQATNHELNDSTQHPPVSIEAISTDNLGVADGVYSPPTHDRSVREPEDTTTHRLGIKKRVSDVETEKNIISLPRPISEAPHFLLEQVLCHRSATRIEFRSPHPQLSWAIQILSAHSTDGHVQSLY